MSLDDWKWIGIFALSWLGMMAWIIWKALHEYPIEQPPETMDDEG